MWSRVQQVLTPSTQRLFHASRLCMGWRQNIAIGYGLPITSTQYKNLKSKVQSITTTKASDSFSSQSPIIFTGPYLQDGGILFMSPVKIHTSRLPLSHSFIGPLKYNQIINELNLNYEYLSQIPNHQKKLDQFLQDNNIDPNQLINGFYNDNPLPIMGEESPLETWIIGQNGESRCYTLKDVYGIYIQV